MRAVQRFPRTCVSGALLLWLGGNALAACVTSPGARLQATVGSVCNATLGSYGASGVPSGQSALGAAGGGIVNAASLVTMTLSQSGINGVYATDAGSQINLRGGLTLSRPGASTGIRALRAASGGTVTVDGPLSITLSNGSSNYGIYAELANTRVSLNGDVNIAMGAGPSYAPGIRATTGASVVANGAMTITTAGDMRSDAITTTDASSYGVALLANNPSISATGTGSITAAGSALGFLAGSGQMASFDGFAITSASGDLAHVDAMGGDTRAKSSLQGSAGLHARW